MTQNPLVYAPPDHRFSFVDVHAINRWTETARVDNVVGGRSWRITAHEPRPRTTARGNVWAPKYLPATPPLHPNVFVDVDAGLLLKVSWQRQQVQFEVIVDYCAGLSFSVQGGDINVAVKANIDFAAQLLPAGGGYIACGATIEEAQQGAMSAWAPTRSKDTGTIAHVTAGVTDLVFIPIPPHARAFRWHQYAGAAAGASTAITFRQLDSSTGPVRATARTGSTPASWPAATGAIPVVGTAAVLEVQNNDAAADVAFWIEFLLDLGG